MKNFQAVYDRAVGRVTKTPEEKEFEEAQKNPEDAIQIQRKINWLNDHVTQEMQKALAGQAIQLVDEAIELACTFPQHQNPHKIIENLIRANQLHKIIQTITL